MKRRLRVFDLATPWFWMVVFYFGKRYGNTWAEVNLFDAPKWERLGWIHVWQWEDIPVRHAQAADPIEATRFARSLTQRRGGE